MTETKKFRTWVEIDRSAIKHNFETFKGLINGNTKLACVVKSNAYGHDIVQFAREVVSLGADFLCVDDLDEALLLRQGGIQIPILILGHVPKERLLEALQNDIAITVANFHKLAQVQKLPMKVHIKVDTGLGRQGFLPVDKEKLLAELSSEHEFIVEGLYSHFAVSKSPENEYSREQVNKFKDFISAIEGVGLHPIKHISSSAGTLLWPEFNFDMVRIGMSMYGLWPSLDVREAVGNRIELRPALTWKSIVSEIKEIERGAKIGYDLTCTLDRDSRVAIVPVGYWHGYDRGLSNIGEVSINGKKARVLGRVAMGMIVVDITDIPDVVYGNHVELLGTLETAYDIARKLETSHYEIVTRINQNIPRVYN